MADVTPVAMSRLLTSLVGREVRFAPVSVPDSKTRQLYVTYHVLPDNEPLVVKTDLPLLGALGGALVGLPFDTAMARAEENPMGEVIRDAIHEVLNIASRALSQEQRVIFKSMAQDPVYCDAEVVRILKNPGIKTQFKVSVGNEVSGLFSIMTK